MKIFIITASYMTDKNSYIGCCFRDQAIALIKAGHDVTLLVGGLLDHNNFFDSSSCKLQKLNDNGVHLYSFRIPSFFLGRLNVLPYWMSLYTINKLFRLALKEQGRPDILHGHISIDGGLCALQIAKTYKLPLVITEHSSAYAAGEITGGKVEFTRRVLDRADAFIAVSRGHADAIRRVTDGVKEITVIPNLVDIEYFSSALPKYKKDTFTVLSCGSLIKLKGMDILLRAFALAFKDISNVRLVIVGDGIQKKNLERLTSSLEIDKRVLFTGQVTRQVVAEYMQGCDCFALASRVETFGVVFIEATSCGKPIIATKTDGAMDIVTPDIGILVNIDDVDSFGMALKNVYNNKHRFDSTVIREYAKKLYSEEAVTRRIEAVYSACLQRVR